MDKLHDLLFSNNTFQVLMVFLDLPCPTSSAALGTQIAKEWFSNGSVEKGGSYFCAHREMEKSLFYYLSSFSLALLPPYP